MKKIFTILLFTCFTVALSAQSSVKNQHISIAKEYVDANPSDTKAKTLLTASKVTKEYVTYFKSVSPKYAQFIADRNAQRKAANANNGNKAFRKEISSTKN